MAKKRFKVKFGKLIFALLLLAITVYGVIYSINAVARKVIERSYDAYIASSEYKIKLYDLDFKETTIEVIRGTKISLFLNDVKKAKTETTEEEVYRKINYNKKLYLVRPENVSDKFEDSVTEKKMYVRTPVTVYEKKDDVLIAGVAKKGTSLEVIGFDKINSDGSINMYKIKNGDTTGFVYSKYLVKTEELSLKNYDEENNYKLHLARTDKYGGGEGGTLDFYPYEKPKFEDNVMPSEVRSFYLNSGVLGNIDAYIALAKSSNINAFVVDVKENTMPAYPIEAIKLLSPTTYTRSGNTFDAYKAAIKKLKDEGFYVIGRVTTFKDSYLITDHPEYALATKSTGQPYKHNGSFWPSSYNRDVWEYNVKIAIDAVKNIGFNEIQFDYVRFPDQIYTVEKTGAIDMKNTYNETKSQAIQGFLMYACDELHKVGAYVSADVFGESTNTYVTSYGQYWGAISNVVDVISAMPYPDHFNMYEYGFSVPVWTIPYQLLKKWGDSAMARQQEIPTPAIVRTWIQAYNTIKAPYITYDATKLSEEIQGLYDAGLTGGYMTWNGSSNITKYSEISAAFKKDYLN